MKKYSLSAMLLPGSRSHQARYHIHVVACLKNIFVIGCQEPVSFALLFAACDGVSAITISCKRKVMLLTTSFYHDVWSAMPIQIRNMISPSEITCSVLEQAVTGWFPIPTVRPSTVFCSTQLCVKFLSRLPSGPVGYQNMLLVMFPQMLFIFCPS